MFDLFIEIFKVSIGDEWLTVQTMRKCAQGEVANCQSYQGCFSYCEFAPSTSYHSLDIHHKNKQKSQQEQISFYLLMS